MKHLRITLVPAVILATILTPAIGQRPQVKFAPAVAYDSAGIFPDSVVVSDLKRDGQADVIVLNECQILQQGTCETPGQLGVLLGNGDGTFGAAASFGTGAYWAYSLGAGDVNGDGIPDLVVANICQSLGPYLECTGYGTVSVLLGNGDGTFRPAATYSTGAYDAYAVAIGDVNGDQMPDLVVANLYQGQSQQTGSASVLLGNGDGTFQAAVNYSSGGMRPIQSQSATSTATAFRTWLSPTTALAIKTAMLAAWACS